MAKGWQLKLIRPIDAVTVSIDRAWALALGDLEKWMKSDLIDALVHGGFSIKGISQTAFYRFITSPEGLGQLGIETSDPPRLLEAYKRTFKVFHNRRLITLRFGDVAKLKMATPHPSAGLGHLHVTSWLEFIVDGVEAKSGFVPRAKLPVPTQKAIRVRSSPGGLMLPAGVFGSKGVWKFPKVYQNYEERWLKANMAKIEKAILRAAVRFLKARLS